MKMASIIEREFLLGGDPMDEDTDGDCIKDGDEWEFAASVLRPESAAIISEDVDQDGTRMAMSLVVLWRQLFKMMKMMKMIQWIRHP